MVRLVVAIGILSLFVAACGGGEEETPTGTGTPAASSSPTATVAGTVTPPGSVTPSGTEPANGQRFDLEAATITLDDLPEGWKPGVASSPNSLSGFDQSYFTAMEREDGAAVRVTMVVGTPESVAALRKDVEAARQQAFGAEISPLDELIPGAAKSVGKVPGVIDEAITFIVGPVLTTVWVSFPADSKLEPSAEDIAKLVYDRILKQVQ
jgi:hypothetical protein